MNEYATGRTGGKTVMTVVVTIVVLAAVAGGVLWAWRSHFGPTPASKADCTLAQQLFDRAAAMPADPQQAKAADEDIRKIRYGQMKDDGLSTQVGRYSGWQLARKTGAGTPPTDKYDRMISEATGHCSGSGVKLTIADIK